MKLRPITRKDKIKRGMTLYDRHPTIKKADGTPLLTELKVLAIKDGMPGHIQTVIMKYTRGGREFGNRSRYLRLYMQVPDSEDVPPITEPQFIPPQD